MGWVGTPLTPHYSGAWYKLVSKYIVHVSSCIIVRNYYWTLSIQCAKSHQREDGKRKTTIVILAQL